MKSKEEQKNGPMMTLQFESKMHRLQLKPTGHPPLDFQTLELEMRNVFNLWHMSKLKLCADSPSGPVLTPCVPIETLTGRTVYVSLD